MNKKQIRKKIINMQNLAAGAGRHIPSVDECRAAIERKLQDEQAQAK